MEYIPLIRAVHLHQVQQAEPAVQVEQPMHLELPVEQMEALVEAADQEQQELRLFSRHLGKMARI